MEASRSEERGSQQRGYRKHIQDTQSGSPCCSQWGAPGPWEQVPGSARCGGGAAVPDGPHPARPRQAWLPGGGCRRRGKHENPGHTSHGSAGRGHPEGRERGPWRGGLGCCLSSNRGQSGRRLSVPHPQCTRASGLLSDGALTGRWICLHPSVACGGDSRAVSETLQVASPSLALAVSFLLLCSGDSRPKIHTLSLTHTHTRREGGRRSRTPKCGSGFKHAPAVLGEVSQLGWELWWPWQAGRGREWELV